jgi:hypothetical protein
MGDRQRLLSVFRHVSEQFAYGGSFMVKIVGGTLPYDSMMTGQKVDAFLIAKYPVMLAEWESGKSVGNPMDMNSKQVKPGGALLSR